MKHVLGLALLLAGCEGAAPDQPIVDASNAADGSGSSAGDGGGLVGGSLAVSWMHGAANCNTSTDPEVQLHSYNTTTHILRQDKCRTFEAPFVYVLVGTTKALVLDTGDLTSTTLRQTIAPLVAGKTVLVAHSHAHGDHTRGDSTFSGQPNTTVVAPNRAAVEAAFGIAPWPTDVATYDLGDRVLDVLAIPGHEGSHIAIYDRQTGLLLTGDTLYPGLLFINDWAQYRTSIARLAQFVATHAITHVLGAHIEMTSTPQVNYPYGTTYQPAEHALPLTAAHVTELDAALTSLGASPPGTPVPHDDFVIDPP